jgi:hypothetical protein
MREIDLQHVHTASPASIFNIKFLVNVLAEFAAVICGILNLSEGFRDIFPVRGATVTPGTAKMLSQGYSHVHRAVGGPTSFHEGSSRGGGSLG